MQYAESTLKQFWKVNQEYEGIVSMKQKYKFNKQNESATKVNRCSTQRIKETIDLKITFIIDKISFALVV